MAGRKRQPLASGEDSLPVAKTRDSAGGHSFTINELLDALDSEEEGRPPGGKTLRELMAERGKGRDQIKRQLLNQLERGLIGKKAGFTRDAEGHRHMTVFYFPIVKAGGV
jgi:hypothetical protein